MSDGKGPTLRIEKVSDEDASRDTPERKRKKKKKKTMLSPRSAAVRAEKKATNSKDETTSPIPESKKSSHASPQALPKKGSKIKDESEDNVKEEKKDKDKEDKKDKDKEDKKDKDKDADKDKDKDKEKEKEKEREKEKEKENPTTKKEETAPTKQPPALIPPKARRGTAPSENKSSDKTSSPETSSASPPVARSTAANEHEKTQIKSSGGFGGFANKLFGGLGKSKAASALSPGQDRRMMKTSGSLKEDEANSAPTKTTKKTIEIETLEALPKDILRQIKQAGINLQTVSADDELALILLNCLHFLTKNQFVYTPPGREGTEKKKSLTVGRRSKKKQYRLEKFSTDVTSIGGPEIKRDIKLQEVTGEGGFGRVYLAKTQKPMNFGGFEVKKNDRVAIKKMKHGPDDKNKYRNFKEVMCLKALAGQSVNIVRYFNSYIIDEEIWVMMEFMEGGSLSEAIKGNGVFEEGAVAYVAKEMLSGIKFLHDRDLIHRDLKSANIMMTIEGDVKLIDFGLCIKQKPSKKTSGEEEAEEDSKLGHMVGSPFWMAPEMIRREKCGREMDIWSFAVCLLELANGEPPCRDSALKAMFTSATEGYPESGLKDTNKWSADFVEFLKGCFELTPSKRKTADELLKSEWLKKAHTKRGMRSLLSRVFLSSSLDAMSLTGI
eukprot:TRINITY_DN224_c0_g1_i1.p1 TRINITY_DN224_c0_g1~~TRINITY_DN224_c0_g1_i1.p1  ORF type:complete len:666 (-),score=192.69 TRINITY_DN224_c0_g1_i1:175-2172(-)